MQNSLKNELLSHVIQTIKDQELEDFDELHYHAFNEDYYIIGYYQADQWLKNHDISAWEAIADVIQWEQDTLGEVSLKPEDINSEKVVNLYVYVKGEELLADFDLDQDMDSLLADLEAALEE